MISILEKLVGVTNNILWTYVIIAMLIGLGLYFSFQAFCMSSAACTGSGT